MVYKNVKANTYTTNKTNKVVAMSDYIENPIDIVENNYNLEIYGNKCAGCRSCGGGCYGCRVTSDMLESKIKDAA